MVLPGPHAPGPGGVSRVRPQRRPSDRVAPPRRQSHPGTRAPRPARPADQPEGSSRSARRSPAPNRDRPAGAVPSGIGSSWGSPTSAGSTFSAVRVTVGRRGRGRRLIRGVTGACRPASAHPPATSAAGTGTAADTWSARRRTRRQLTAPGARRRFAGRDGRTRGRRRARSLQPPAPRPAQPSRTAEFLIDLPPLPGLRGYPPVPSAALSEATPSERIA